ncbi:hypothetical protein [Streptomyces sp. UNOB3_S3]|uniref:hypothetical protein n=1 Tax=Streptomyces sp. UNOB3_S3 TaxID=2871682 RepID=UPI001E4600C8|nr:hypothetical protein [Streptomyces sp. UNOB3_S3]MCC3779280.1 hypothetical protein [Streptomyces sp. UNOB3_S3]
MTDPGTDPTPQPPEPQDAPEPQGSQEAQGPSEAQGLQEPLEPEPLGVGRTPTGDPGVDAHLARLADADHLDASGHLAVYEDVHQGLRDALGALDRPPGPPPGPARPYDNRS